MSNRSGRPEIPPPGEARRRPKVFVVTPSYNQGEFLRATIDSVLAQDYEAVDYFVADGGSSDDSVEILSSYGGRVRWVSAPDGGQAAAIAAAWARTDADVVAWLNSDDLYEPGAISKAVAYLLAHPECSVVYGKGWYTDRHGVRTRPYPTRPFDAAELFHTCFICQPAAFVRRRVFEVAELPDPKLRYCMDYDLWIRLARDFRFGYLEEYLARARMYQGNKTLGERGGVFREIERVTARHFGITSRNWTVAHALHRSRRRVERFFGFLPAAVRRRVEGALVRRAESRLVGPLYADQWAGSRTRIEVEPDAAGRVGLICQAPFWPYRRPLEIAVTHNGRALGRTRADREHFSIDVRIPEPREPRVPLLLEASRTFVPQDWDLSPDARPVSFLVRAVEPGEARTNGLP